jgi:hypothetical protein
MTVRSEHGVPRWYPRGSPAASAPASTKADYSFGTIAYNAATGAWLWTSRYTGPGAHTDTSRAITISPNGASVFITGTSYRSTAAGTDYATIAYRS